MGATLVAYFSATGTTAEAAQAIAEEIGADLQEITPAHAYTAADLDWTNANSRSSREHAEGADLPELGETPGDLSAYDTVLIGFPIWWYTAPKIISAWVRDADLAGKRVILWATSGGSGLGATLQDLEPFAPEATWENGRVVHGTAAARRWALALS